MASTIKFVCLLALFASSLAAAPKKKPTLKEYKAGKAKEAAHKAGADAKQSKMAAVDKLIEMMGGLQRSVIKEGEEEAKTFNKFTCFCKTMMKDKNKLIKKEKDAKAELKASVNKLNKKTKKLRGQISQENADIEKAEKEKTIMRDENQEALALYERNVADLSAAIREVQDAVKVFKTMGKNTLKSRDHEVNKKSGSLLQLASASKSIDTALMLADALGLKVPQNNGQIFLQGPAVEMENYKGHSVGIISTLEELVVDFRSKKNDLDKAERTRVATYNNARENNKGFRKATAKEQEDDNASKDKKTAKTAEETKSLKTEIANLRDDQQYLKKLSEACTNKAKTYDQRTKSRMQELMSITQALDIIKTTVSDSTTAKTVRLSQISSAVERSDFVANDDDMMEALEAEAEGAQADSFMQTAAEHQTAVRTRDDDTKERVVELLKSSGMQFKSAALIGLASQLTADPFTKIKKLIQELVERLLQESANEANQKGWCDKALGDASQRHGYASEKVDDLKAEIAESKATREKLIEDIATLISERKALRKSQVKSKKMRAEEAAESKETIAEAKVGLGATKQAMTIMSRFYATARKNGVKLGLEQESSDEARPATPGTSFKTGTAYKGNGKAASGIMGMMEVISSDFIRTMKETAANEVKAKKEYYDFMTETGMSLAEKKMATQEKKKYKDEVEDTLDTADDNLKAQSKLLAQSKKELKKLEPVCHPKPMSYEERVARREGEIQALNKALCITSSADLSAEGC